MKITSRDNSLLRRARTVRDGRVEESIFVEGLRLCDEALGSGLEIEAVIYSEELPRKERAAQLIEKLDKVCSNVASVSEKLLECCPCFFITPCFIVEMGQSFSGIRFIHIRCMG